MWFYEVLISPIARRTSWTRNSQSRGGAWWQSVALCLSPRFLGRECLLQPCWLGMLPRGAAAQPSGSPSPHSVFRPGIMAGLGHSPSLKPASRGRCSQSGKGGPTEGLALTGSLLIHLLGPAVQDRGSTGPSEMNLAHGRERYERERKSSVKGGKKCFSSSAIRHFAKHSWLRLTLN